jgi:AcrR family transcriptional regulator
VPGRRGWGGDPPVDDQDARRRIVEAATTCLDRDDGPRFSLAVVAAELGVIRQTVYRYFASMEELHFAVAEATVLAFIDLVDERLRGITDPVEWAVECLASGIEILPTQRHLVAMLDSGDAHRFTRSFTSSGAMTIGRELFERAEVDWSEAGFEERDVEDLEELMLRLLLSYVISPRRPERSGPELRRSLCRWLRGAVLSPAASDQTWTVVRSSPTVTRPE